VETPNPGEYSNGFQQRCSGSFDASGFDDLKHVVMPTERNIKVRQ
jgi:hypothetical protein